ncbi:MAG: hypothetical protein IKS20_03870 [Victivallales bacterium]|nr:hypothetical protein [Victivallales bacterium]
MWLDVPKEYEAWLCDDRCDAFLVAIIYWALIKGEDIVCEAPVTENLLYKLREYLVEGLVKADGRLKGISIEASPIPCISSKKDGAVVTGMSCGIDSFHALAHLMQSDYAGLRPTHLLFNKVGAQGSDPIGEEQHRFRVANARALSKEAGLPLIEVESNVHLLIPLKHEVHGGYRNAFVIFALQCGISAYFLASSKILPQLDMSQHHIFYTFYDLVLMDVFSSPCLQFYSEGANLTRFEKTRELVSFAPSYTHLNVCFWAKGGDGRNCTVNCEKCQRTILDLEALGCLEKYSSVFDLDLYHANQGRLFKNAIKLYARGNKGYKGSWPWLQKQWPVRSRILYAWYRFLDFFRKMGKRR